MPLNFQSTKTMKPTRSRWFFVGEMGSGKTSCANTFPDPVFIVYSGENSLATLASRGVDVDFIEVTAGDVKGQLNNIFEELLVAQKKNPKDPDLPGQTLVWESLTHFSAGLVEQFARESKHGQMDQQQWGKLASFFAHAQQILWQIDMNIVFTAYPHYKTNDKSEIIWAGPRIQGSAAETLPGACEHHAYCDVLAGDGSKRADIYRTYLRKVNNYPARTRSSKLPRDIQNFNYAELAHLIY